MSERSRSLSELSQLVMPAAQCMPSEPREATYELVTRCSELLTLLTIIKNDAAARPECVLIRRTTEQAIAQLNGCVPEIQS
jgi:hypothetical protein